MWITTVTIDMDELRELDIILATNMVDALQEKKAELQDLDGDGKIVPGTFEAFPYDEIPVSAATITLKRAWNNESYAQQWLDYCLDGQLPVVSATVEAQL